jgi:hypothetical protein
VKEYLNGDAIAHPTEVFDPGTIRTLTTAFDAAWQRLQNSGVGFESDHQSDQARNTLAKYIIEQARQGERDERRLSDSQSYSVFRLRNPVSAFVNCIVVLAILIDRSKTSMKRDASFN